jgi:hypothetical protein
MTHLLHAHLSAQLADLLKERRVVVWFDPDEAFAPYIDELAAKSDDDEFVASVKVATLATRLARWRGSYFGLRDAVEPLVAVDRPDPLLVYVPAARPPLSPLLELEKAGAVFNEPVRSPAQVARAILRAKHTDAEVDALLDNARADYAGLAKLLSLGSGGPGGGLLKRIVGEADGDAALVARWIADPGMDGEIVDRGARPELLQLLTAAAGLTVAGTENLDMLREAACAWVLVGEFLSDFTGDPPAGAALVGRLKTPEQAAFVRSVARLLRTGHGDAYAALADAVERKYALGSTRLSAAQLGSIDTFRFEEAVLLDHACDVLADGRFAEAKAVVDERAHSFWLLRSADRRARWEAVRAMAELALAVELARPQVEALRGNAGAWIDAYTGGDGWHRIDRMHRRMEELAADLHGDAEAALARVRQCHDGLVSAMAEGFAGALRDNHWVVPWAMAQTRVYADVVAHRPAPVAYFLVDALRFEMGVELRERLPEDAEVSLRPAVAALPTITPVGMAALMPGAASDFVLAAEGDRMVPRIGASPLPDAAARMRHLQAMVPGVKVILLDDVFGWGREKLKRAIAGAPMVVVRSGEIDALGEAGHRGLARQAMGNVIGTLALAMRRLAEAGVHHQVVAADHGHLFGNERGDEMKIDAPGGRTVDLHRRCWAGRGGATPAGCVRVRGQDLGCGADLDFVFPLGTGVFKAGGDLAFHHGGLSLQELIIPVLTAHLVPDRQDDDDVSVSIEDALPEELTARVLAVKLTIEHGGFFDVETLDVRPVLVEQGRQVGSLALALDAPYADGVVTLTRGRTASVGILLTDETARSVDIMVLDAATGRVLGNGGRLRVKLGVV